MGSVDAVLGEKDVEDVDELIPTSIDLAFCQYGSKDDGQGLFKQVSSSSDPLVDPPVYHHQFPVEFSVLNVVLLEDFGRVEAVLAESHELSLTVANLLHSAVDCVVGHLMLFLTVSAQLVRWPLDDVDPVVGDILVKTGNLRACLHDGLPEAGASGSSIDIRILNTINDDIDAVAAVGKHDAEAVEHLQFLLGHLELAALVLQGHHDQEPHLLQISSHRADVVEVYQLPKTRTVRVARHVHDGVPVVTLPSRIEVRLLCHRLVRVPDDVLVGHVAGIDKSELSAVVNYFHGCAIHGQGQCGRTRPRISNENDALFIARKALSELESVSEVLVAFCLALRDTCL